MFIFLTKVIKRYLKIEKIYLYKKTKYYNTNTKFNYNTWSIVKKNY